MSMLSNALIRRELKKLKRELPVSVPQDFTWRDNPITPTIVTDYQGNFRTTFDVANLQYTDGVTYWVSELRGNDGAPGTFEQPLARINEALRKENVGTVMVESGIYGRHQGISHSIPPLLGDNLGSVSIKAVPGHEVILTQHDITPWTHHSGSVYKKDRSSVKQVLDLARPVSGYEYFSLTLVNSVAEVAQVEDSWFTDGATVYVHIRGGEQPDSRTLAPMLGTEMLYMTGGKLLYLEGITFVGGRYQLRVDATETEKPKVYVKNCKFLHSKNVGTERGVTLNGVSEAILQDCIAANNTSDGFNYHGLHGVAPKVIEINCMGINNGETGNKQNGSSIHDGGKIIRVNGVYFNNRGPNVADVNEGTESLNYGVTAFASVADNVNQNSDFTVTSGAKMWLDNCESYSSVFSLDARTEGVIYTRKGSFEGETVEGAIIKKY